MLKYTNFFLKIGLAIVAFVTLFNILSMYWIPVRIPVSSFSAVRIMFIAIAEKRFYLVPVSVLICVMLFLSCISIHKQKFVLPCVASLYLTYDLVVLFLVMIDSQEYGYWRNYMIETIISIVLLSLLIIYIVNWISSNCPMTKGGAR